MTEVYSRSRFMNADLFICDNGMRGEPLGNGDIIYSLEEVFPLLHNGTYLLIISAGHSDAMTVKKKLILEGFIENEDYFMSDTFKKCYLPIWALYAHGKCYVEYMGHITNWNCTLRCKACSASIPYLNLKNPSVEQVKEEIDLFFKKVDICYTYDCTSGEIFAISDKLVEVLEYLVENYSGKFAKILIVTNATIVPSKRMLEFLRAHQDIVEINVSVYSSVPGWNEKFERFSTVMMEWGIQCIATPTDEWIDLGFKNTTHNMSEEELIKKFDFCNNFCRLYINGKIYYCGHGQMANLAFYSDVNDEDEAIDLRDNSISALNIVEYLLGYFDKGYLSVCDHCKGWGCNNKNFIPIAEQLEN